MYTALERVLIVIYLLLSGTPACAVEPLSAEELHAVLLRSMQTKGQAGLDRLKQDELQAACSRQRNVPLDPALDYETQRIQLAEAVKFPEDGGLLGDWKLGEEIAQSDRGLRYSDDPSEPNGGNCYGCHQLDPVEPAYGTMGMSLSNFRVLRGYSREFMEYTWTKLWDSHIYQPCSHMPRFGARGILTIDQLRHVMAYLFDPKSPVNASPGN